MSDISEHTMDFYLNEQRENLNIRVGAGLRAGDYVIQFSNGVKTSYNVIVPTWNVT